MADKVWIGTTDGSFTTATNWLGGVAPVSGDRLIFDYRAVRDLTAALNQSAVTGTIVAESSFTKYVGDGTNYLQFGASSCVIGQNTSADAGAGSARLMFDFGATANVTTIYRTADAPATTEPYVQPVRLKGGNVQLNVSGASNVGFCQSTGETGTLAALRVTAGPDGATPTVEVGRGVTVTAQNINAGTVHSLSDNTAAATDVDGGTYNYEGTGGHTTLTVRADSTCYYSGTGTAGTTEVRGGTFDCTRDGRSKTFTTFRAYAGSSLLLDNGVNTSLTFTNPIEFPDGIGKLTAFQTAPSVKGTLVNI
jgi:hypothetical protein